MHTKVNDWKNGWYGIELSLKADEIDSMIVMLQALKNEPGQHFHLSSDYAGSDGLGDIEISIQPAHVVSNMMSMSKAVGSGESIPDRNRKP